MEHSCLYAKTKPYRKNDKRKKGANFPLFLYFGLNLSYDVTELYGSLQPVSVERCEIGMHNAHVINSKNHIKFVHLKCHSDPGQAYYLDFCTRLLTNLRYCISKVTVYVHVIVGVLHFPSI